MFFGHALEILLHSVVEEDATIQREPDSPEGADGKVALLPNTVEFLDHFDAALDVVVGCARKIEMSRWPRLFEVVGNPKTLFEARYFPVSVPFRSYWSIGVSLFWPIEDGWIISLGAAQPGAA